ncbi:MAG: excinuclease ABC subunit UvrA [Chlamydiae bacterium]|nr:excinuclease ABC subunit UvrA [Chlamydiota bacterium]MBI3277956.1 excinuclease ABC subunit UvrA [Chlamydiota bacterium]
MIQSKISIRGASEHTLKNVHLDLPHHQLIVITGVSGSGKSSLVMDTLYREGQRKFFELLPGDLLPFGIHIPRSQVDSIDGLPPVFCMSGESSRSTLRSTIGTVTEISDFLRILFSRAGDIFCYRCHRQLRSYTPQEMVEEILKLPKKTSVMILAPLPQDVSIAWLRKEGFVRIRMGGVVVSLEDLKDQVKGPIQLVIDRLNLSKDSRGRLADAIELALRYGEGLFQCASKDGSEDRSYSTDIRCLNCNIHYGILSPSFFSFNSPQGACSKCHGLGVLEKEIVCPECQGARLKKEVLSVKLDAYSMADLQEMNLLELNQILKKIHFKEKKRQEVVKEVIPRIKARLEVLIELGLGYLSLGRSVPTLSGGEIQRVRMAAHMASGLVGVLYVLDEPTIGLHPSEVDSLIQFLMRMRDQGNTLVVIEHDEEVIKLADLLVELGPGAGPEGGKIIAIGTPQKIKSSENTPTAQLLQHALKTPFSFSRKEPEGFIHLKGLSRHNLKNIHAQIPLGVFCCMTGVSGAGKSTLVDYLCEIGRVRVKNHPDLENFDAIKKMIVVDSKSIAASSRSMIATYLGIFDEIRSIFSSVPESRMRGFTAKRFSLMATGGRCEACLGTGTTHIEMVLMSDLDIPCEICQGLRYNRETLEVKFKGKNIAEVLEMTANEALLFFKSIYRVVSKINFLDEIGLGYLKLGQSTASLSGGESQRLKLVTELSKHRQKGTLFILDEPSQGLHLSNLYQVLKILFRLRDQGNSILVIEHDLEVIRLADHIIDLGPGAGPEGGKIVAQGTPEEVAKCEGSKTGRYLKKVVLN